jgi:hypothetical protein
MLGLTGTPELPVRAGPNHIAAPASRGERRLTYGVCTLLSPVAPAWIVGTFGGNEQTPALIRGDPEIIAALEQATLSPTEVSRAIARQITDYKDRWNCRRIDCRSRRCSARKVGTCATSIGTSRRSRR